MKNLILLVLLSVVLASCGSSRPVNKIYREYSRFDEGVTKLRIPGWLFWLGSGIAHESLKDEDARKAMEIVRKVKGMRFMVVEKENTISKAKINKMLGGLRENNFEDLFYIKDGATTVSFMIREKKDKIKNLFIVVSEPDNFMLTHLKTKIKYSDLTKLLQKYQKEMKIEKAIQKIPQA